MDKKIDRYDLTSADSKIIGFDFQYFYFIKLLLELKENNLIGFEVKDDIHIDLHSGNDNQLILIQVKYSRKKNSSGSVVNLTDFDTDLWKTLSNWTKVIIDKNQNRNTIKEQLFFLDNTKFILATDKNLSHNNFISMVIDYKNDRILINDVREYIVGIKNKTLDKNIKKYLDDIVCLEDKLFEKFLKNINFIDTGKDIIESIKSSIRGYFIKETNINDVFNDILSTMKQDFFKKVSGGEHQLISYDEKIRLFTPIFEKFRSTKLPIRKFIPTLPNNLFDQNFIKELIEIGDISIGDLPEVTEYTEFMLNMQLNLDRWRVDGEIVTGDIEDFHENNYSYWKNIHKKCHRSTITDSSLDNVNALSCLDDVRIKELSFGETPLGINLSNGEFYKLSNENRIGWKIKWKDKY